MEHKQLIIKALQSGVPVTRIAKELKIPIRTLWWKIDKDPDLKHAKGFYNQFVLNLFSDFAE